jgi:ectoine hydroxylase-related dioxygenase (phytanoyl-CoA dioxygenase family)
MPEYLSQLETDGFAVIPGPIAPSGLGSLSEAYDRAFNASEPELQRGRSNSNTRLNGLINRDEIFDPIYVHEPMLAAAAHVIGAPFKLSAFHARTVHPYAAEQPLHQDFAPLSDGFPMLGFIFMVDDFRRDNGATRFVTGSCKTKALTGGSYKSLVVSACGPAGSMIVFNGSVWHGFGANSTAFPRRSVQGALIRRDQHCANDYSRQVRPAVAARLSPAAKTLLCLAES